VPQYAESAAVCRKCGSTPKVQQYTESAAVRRGRSSTPRKSTTFVHGKENSQHKELAGTATVALYFYHPHSPWETDYKSSGMCENTNYQIRDMLYPKDDFRELTRRDVPRIAASLNDRPRKTLDWKPPKEVLFGLH
jgi:IS30 family transposase